MKSLVIGLKLLLLGMTKSFAKDDPSPVIVEGEKAVSSDKIDGYMTEELFYYYEFYVKVKHAGSPYGAGWMEWPAWMPQLIIHFDNAVEMMKRYFEKQAYEEAGAKGKKYGRP